MNKALLLISLFIANLQALPETLPTDKRQELPEISKRRSLEDELPSQQKDDFLSSIENSTISLKRKAYLTKDYAHNQIVIQIIGIKTDSLQIASKTGDGMTMNLLIVEDENEEFAEIIIATKNKGSYVFGTYLTNTPFYLMSQEEIFGQCSYNDDFQVSYSKENQTVTIIIPFKFSRKVIPVNLIK